MTHATGSQTEHVHQIDALRGLAACAVAFIYHGWRIGGVYKTGPLDGLPVISWLYDYGYTAVDLFFVISGYVFAHVYLTGDGLRGGVTLRAFMAARIARLYPLHLATLLLMAAILLAGTGDMPGHDGWHFLLNLLFLQESGLNQGYSFNVPAWSLSVEMLCYLLFILAALAGRRVLAVSAVLFVLVGLVATASEATSVVNVGRGLTGYFTGYLIWRHRETLDRVPAWLAIAFVAGILAVHLKLPFVFYGASLSVTAWPILLLLSKRSAVLTSAPLRWLGARSYSIYLLHFPVYGVLLFVVTAGQPVPPAMQGAALAFCIATTLLLSHFSFLYFEAPMRRLIRDFAEGKRSASPVRTPGLTPEASADFRSASSGPA